MWRCNSPASPQGGPRTSRRPPWAPPCPSGAVPDLNGKAFSSIEEWRRGPREGDCPYVFVDGIYLKRSWGGPYENAAVLVAIGTDSSGDREIIGCSECYTESADSWRGFFLDEVVRAVRHPPGHGRQVRGHARRALPAMHRALLPKRPVEGARHEAEGGDAHA